MAAANSFSPRFEMSDVSPADAAWLRECERSRFTRATMIDLTDICATVRVACRLVDAHGREVGFVRCDGEFSLA